MRHLFIYLTVYKLEAMTICEIDDQHHDLTIKYDEFPVRYVQKLEEQ